MIGNWMQTFEVIGNVTVRGSGCDRDHVIGECDRSRIGCEAKAAGLCHYVDSMAFCDYLISAIVCKASQM